MPDLLFCLDPGTTTGIALLALGRYRPEAVVQLDSRPFIEALSLVSDDAGGTLIPDAPHVVGIVIEDTRRQPIHAKRGAGKNSRQLAKIARDVGRIDLMVDLLEAAAKRAGFPVVMIPPTSGKWDAERLAQITGYDGTSNEHKRDAVRAGWGVTRMHLEQAKPRAA